MDKFIGLGSGDHSDGNHDLGSDEEFFGGKAGYSEDEMSSYEEDQKLQGSLKKAKKSTFDVFDAQSDEDVDSEQERDVKTKTRNKSEPKEESIAGHEEQQNLNELYRKSKLKALKDKKPKGKTGVVYLSKIPPYMKPTKMRQILSRFGDVDRLFLKREPTQKHQQRVKTGGNKKIMYEEGWAEFIRKKDAKLASDTLNGNTLGGKKGSFYYDDVMNVKYLSGFKWADLTEQISRENEIRQSKLQLEISQARKLNKTFINNVQKSKMIENIKSKKKAHDHDSNGNDDGDFRRTFNQRDVNTTRADAPKKHKKERKSGALANVL